MVFFYAMHASCTDEASRVSEFKGDIGLLRGLLCHDENEWLSMLHSHEAEGTWRRLHGMARLTAADSRCKRLPLTQ